MYQFNEEEYNARMTWYRDARFGMFLHWGLYSIPARGEWVRSVEQMPEEEYMPFFREFSASRFDPASPATAAGVNFRFRSRAARLFTDGFFE